MQGDNDEERRMSLREHLIYALIGVATSALLAWLVTLIP